MVKLIKLSYSHEEAVRAFRDFYNFITIMYVDESSVEWPPEGGWPSITPERYAGLGKTDEVISLLRELPYFTREAGSTEPIPGCTWANWVNVGERTIKSQDFRGKLAGSEGIGSNGERGAGGVIPPHAVAITMGDRENDNIFVDTKRGVIFWDVGCPDDLRDAKRIDVGSGRFIEKVTHLDDGDLPESTGVWPLCQPCWTIPDFFELLKHHFRTLQFVPVTPSDVSWFCESGDEEDMNCDEDVKAEASAMRKIYRRYGWPPASRGGSGDYDKAGCLKAMKRLVEKHFPDRVMWYSDEMESEESDEDQIDSPLQALSVSQ